MVCWLRSGIRFSTPLRACCRTLFTDVVGSYAAQSALGKIGVRTVATASTLLLGIGSLLLTQISADGSCFGDLFLGHQHRRMPGRRSTRRRHLRRGRAVPRPHTPAHALVLTIDENLTLAEVPPRAWLRQGRWGGLRGNARRGRLSGVARSTGCLPGGCG